MSDRGRYCIERVSGGRIDISGVTVANVRSLELDLDQVLSAGVLYRLAVENMLTEGGRIFTDDMDRGRMDDASAYTLERAAGGGSIDIDQATIVDDRTVDLALDSALASQTTYVLRVDSVG